jgi:succinate dehydrogenase flavin-adding protein (antitoxin of CptAB toxin-antitoxin module)
LLELDLILERFLRETYAGLDARQREAFEQLLESSDAALMDLIAGRENAGSEAAAFVLNLMQPSNPSR